MLAKAHATFWSPDGKPHVAADASCHEIPMSESMDACVLVMPPYNEYIAGWS